MKQLLNYRKQIDEIDDQIAKLIAKRFAITTKVGEYKSDNNLESVDKEREKEIYKKLTKLAEENKLNKDLLIKIQELIIAEVVKNHEKIKQNNLRKNI